MMRNGMIYVAIIIVAIMFIVGLVAYGVIVPEDPVPEVPPEEEPPEEEPPEEPPEEPVLSYSPASYDFGTLVQDDSKSTSFDVWNSGTGTLDYSFSETCSWLSVTPTSGTSTGEHDTITININTVGLSNAVYGCAIRINCVNPNYFQVSMRVMVSEEPPSDEPVLSYSPMSYNFGDIVQGHSESTNFEIWNSGSGTLTYSLSESCNWLTVTPMSGSSSGEHDTITVNIDTTGLAITSYSCTISLGSNANSESFRVDMRVIAPEEPPSPPSTGIYISPNGNDNNPGTQSSPVASFTKAFQLLDNGETLWIMPGTYKQRVIPTKSDIYIKSTGSGATIDGTGLNINWNEGLVDIKGVHNVTFDSLKVINSPQNAIAIRELTGQQTYTITIRNCITDNSELSGITVASTSGDLIEDVIIERNTITHSNTQGTAEAIRVVNLKDSEVCYNTLYNNYKEGIDILRTSYNVKIYGNNIDTTTGTSPNPEWYLYSPWFAWGIYLDAWDAHAENVDIYNNFIDGANGGIRIGGELDGTSNNINIFNNIITDCAVSFSIDGDSTGTKQNVHVINNDFLESGDNCVQLAGVHSNEIPGFIFRNNILTTRLSNYGMINPGSETNLNLFSVDHNFFESTYSNYFGTDYYKGDPMLTNYKISASSLCRNHGNPSLAPAYDFFGTMRDSQPDIGAHEFTII